MVLDASRQTQNRFWSAVAAGDGISFSTTPLDDVGRDGGCGTLQFNIHYTEFCDGGVVGARVMCLGLDMDRASGSLFGGRMRNVRSMTLAHGFSGSYPVARDCVL